MAKLTKTILVFGTFDVLHPGHKWFLKHARRLGDKLVASVARDSFVKEWKGHPPLTSESARLQSLKESGLVDEALLSDKNIRTYGVIEQIRPEVICLGHDQKALKDDLTTWVADHSDFVTEIVVLPPWKRRRYSSSRRNKHFSGKEPNT